MHFEEDYTYHIYNRSNETLFPEEENYLFFLNKIRKHIIPYSDILAYCLMPNHFHLLVQVKKEGVDFVYEKNRPNTQVLSKQIGLMLSSYTQAINKRFNRIGSLFAHKTKAKQLNNWGKSIINNENEYSILCFNYIHQNPIKSGIVENIEDWLYSSYIDYLGKREESIINRDWALKLLGIDSSYFKKGILSDVNEKDIKMIF